MILINNYNWRIGDESNDIMWKLKISKRDDDSCRKDGIRRILHSDIVKSQV